MKIPPNNTKSTKRGSFAFYRQLDGNLSSYAIVGPLLVVFHFIIENKKK
jgi:hypothetical protein